MAARKPSAGGIGSNQYATKGVPVARADREAVAALAHQIELEAAAAAFEHNPTVDLTKSRSGAALARAVAVGTADQIEKIAARKTCPPEVLDHLASSPTRAVRMVVAANPNCPTETLQRLADEPRLKASVAANPNCPPALLHELARHRVRQVRVAVAENPSSPPEALLILAADPDVHPSNSVIAEVVKHPNCPSEVLAGAYRSHPEALAHPNCPPELLSWAVNDQQEYAPKTQTACNPNCPAELLETLVNDTFGHRHPAWVSIAARNPNFPPALIPDTVSKFIARGYVNDEFVTEAMSADDCPAYLFAELAAANDETKMSQHVPNAALINVVAHPNCPPDTITTFVKIARGRIHHNQTLHVEAAAAANPNCPPPLLAQLAASDHEPVARLAQHTLHENATAGRS